MTKEIIGFINKNNDIFNIKEDSSANKYCCKVGQGHENKIAAFTEDGDLKDSGKTINDLVTKIQPSANGNFASLDENGNLQDSGKKAADFAPASGSTEYAAKNHGHVEISDFTGTNGSGASVKVGEDPGVQGEGVIKLTVKGDGQGTQSDSAEINYDNIGNLKRALEDPATPESGGDNLITNGQVFDAIAQKNSIEQEDLNDEQKARLSAIAEDNDIYFDFRLKNGNTEKKALLTLPKMDNFNRALENPSTTPEDDATKLITSKAVYDALLGKMDNLRSMRITYDTVAHEFVVSESDKAVLVAFRNSVPADTFVPVLVSLYDDDTKDSDVFGLAKWSEEQQAIATDINILVVIGKYYFFVNGDYQLIEDIQFTGWTRTAKGQSFFS